jgi:hypothetical protein
LAFFGVIHSQGINWLAYDAPGCRLLLVRSSRAVQRLLALTAFDESFEIVGDVPQEPRRARAAAVG